MNLDNIKWKPEDVYCEKSDPRSEKFDEYRVQAGILSTNMAMLIELRSLNQFNRASNKKFNWEDFKMSGKTVAIVFVVALLTWSLGAYVCDPMVVAK